MTPSGEVEIVVMVRQRFAANGCGEFKTSIDPFLDAITRDPLPKALIEELTRAFVQAASPVVAFHEGRRR